MESLYRQRRFPPEIIGHAVRLCHRFTLSFRDVEDLLAERGVTAAYEAIRSWRMLFATGNGRCFSSVAVRVCIVTCTA